MCLCLRSKRKMLGRRYPEQSGRRTSTTPAAKPAPCLTRPPTPLGQRSLSSENFKALLLRKGTRSDTTCRTSAVERLRRFRPVTSAPCHTSDAVVTVDPTVTPDDKTLSPDFFRWRPQDPHLLFTSSPFVFLTSSSSLPPRSLTPPCSSSRRFATRCRLYATPMTAILEGEEEEAFVEHPGCGSGLWQSLVKIS